MLYGTRSTGHAQGVTNRSMADLDAHRHAAPSTSPTAMSGRPLRIALVAPPVLPIPPTAYAGTERVVAALADGLVARGHHVTLFASGDSTAGSEVVPVVPNAAWNGRSTGDTSTFGMLAAIRALEHAERFDLIHSHVDVMTLPLALHSPVPVVTTFHSRLDVPGIYE